MGVTSIGPSVQTVDSYLADDAVLPIQFHGDLAIGTGENRLMLAMLEDAIRVYHHDIGGFQWGLSYRDRRETREWLTSDDDSEPFSCLNVLGHLFPSCEPSVVRDAILRSSPQPQQRRMNVVRTHTLRPPRVYHRRRKAVA